MAARIEYFMEMHVPKHSPRHSLFTATRIARHTYVYYVSIYRSRRPQSHRDCVCRRGPECVMFAWFVCNGWLSAQLKKKK